MKKQFKKFLVMLLSAAMIVSTIPAAASATDETPAPETGEVLQEQDPVQPDTDPAGSDEGGEAEPADDKGQPAAPQKARNADVMPLADGDPAPASANDIMACPFTISADGTYQLADGVSGAITIAAGVKNVTIVGNGVVYNNDPSSEQFGAISSTANAVTIDAKAAAGINLTLRDLFNSVRTNTANVVDFSGAGNTLTIEGIVVMDYDCGFTSANDALIHVGKGTALTVSGSGTYYQYNCTQGAGIGGTTKETNGDITFAMTGAAFLKGTRQGAVIGAGANSSSVADLPGTITFTSGEYNIITNSRGAAIGGSAGSSGGSAGTNVVVNGGTLSINTDYSGSAVGGGGYDAGNDSSGGLLTVNGGSIRPYVDTNAVRGVFSGWQGKQISEAGVNDLIITAERKNSAGENLYFCTVDAAGVDPDGNGGYTIAVDGGSPAFYQGKLHRYAYVYDGVDRATSSVSVNPASTIGNWIPETDAHAYLFLTGKDHTVTINGVEQKYLWDSETESFYQASGTKVTIAATPSDADITVSKGIGYTYTEEVVTGHKEKASEDADPTMAYYLAAGNYTATIVKDGYYASEFTFSVSDAGAVSSSAANVKPYISTDAVITIPLTAFSPSSSDGAWDGKTIDVSWYSETASTFTLSTPAQLMGLAAIVNGIYNAEITTIIDDANGDGTPENYKPAEYAALGNRKIRAANSSGTTGSNNMVTTGTYWYGVKSDGKNSDLNGCTINLANDIDMGGYVSGGKWTGARAMSIGGQSPMHFIEFGKNVSDGYSILGSSFNGRLNGNGHFVKNIYMDRYVTGSNFGDSQSVGLVGRLGNHDSDKADVAAVDPAVRNVAVTGFIYGRRSVGGIVGKIGQTSASKKADGSTGGIIENCVNFCEVKNTDSKGCGGIAGAGWNRGVIRNCVNFGEIYAGYKNAGGISGSDEVPVINCYNAGYVNAISYNNAQALGTNNGGAVWTNCYWLTGSSFADSNDSYQYPAVYNPTTSSTITEVSTFADLKGAAFLTNLNGTGRGFATAAASDPITAVLKNTAFTNCKLDVSGVTAEGMPVPRVFTTDTATVTTIEKVSDPTTLSYVEGQTFNPAGMLIRANYSDGTSEEVTDYQISKTEPLAVSDTKITISGEKAGKAYSYDLTITVAANELTALEITTPPTNCVYAAGETFDPAGMVVKATFTNDPSHPAVLEADAYQTRIEGNKLIVSYTYNGKTLEAQTDVTFLSSPAPKQNADGAYEIGSEDELLWFANQVNAMQQLDIDGVVTADFSAGERFTGIGASSRYYAGTFDGAGHTVTVAIKTSGMPGFFGGVGQANIKNLTVAGTVEAEGSVTGTAGIVAYVSDTVTIENCTNKAAIKGNGYTGGIVGKTMSKGAAVKNCVNEGRISASSTYSGGIFGYMSAGSSAEGCINRGNVVSGSGYVGGIAGYASASNAASANTIKECGNDGKVTGQKHVGGIAGSFSGAYNSIESCYNVGDITATALVSRSGAGGIIGTAIGKIDNVYSNATVKESGVTILPSSVANSAGIGCIIGYASGTTTLTNAYSAGKLVPEGKLNDDEWPIVKSGCVIGLTGTSSVTLTNTYAHTDLEAFETCGGNLSSYRVTGEATMLSEEELAAAAEDLGAAFQSNSTTYHDGYPVLTWEQPAEADSYLRLAGSNRYRTALMVADELKEQKGVDKFDAIVIACGYNYPDALAGTYLASAKEAPVLLINDPNKDTVLSWIDENAADDATIYLLGGEGVISADIAASLEAVETRTVTRLAGANRFKTNLAILEEAGVSDEDILVCSGFGFADSLSASAVGKPILLVGPTLTAEQKEYLDGLSSEQYYLIGGSGSVSDAVAEELAAYGNGSPKRVAGANRYTTSLAVAEEFFSGSQKSAVLAWAGDFPDGLCGGALAAYEKAPLILADSRADHNALVQEYLKDTKTRNYTVLGGETLLNDSSVKAMIAR